MSLIALAGSRVTDVKQYLKEASADRSIKYSSEKGAKHHLYIPLVQTQVVGEDGTPKTEWSIAAISQKIHDWSDGNGNYNSTVCLDGLIRKDPNTGALLNDGTCPICQRVQDAWEIYNMRKDELEANCQLPAGKAREDFIKKTLEGYRDDLKAKEARDYVYLLIAVFETNNGQAVIDEETSLPKYALKVMKLSATRLDKINKQLNNSGIELGGSEIIIEYKNTEDIKQQVGESTISLVMESQMFTKVYPALVEKITAEASEFDFDTIDKAFKEWKGMTTEEANIKMKNQFKRWDEYKEALQTNPNAMYLEYSQAATNVAFNNMAAPQVGVPVPQIGAPMDGMVGMPNMQGQTQVPPVAPQPAPMNPMGGFPQGTPVGQVGQQMGVPTPAPQPAPQPAPVQMPTPAPVDSAVPGMGSIPDPNTAFSATNMTI